MIKGSFKALGLGLARNIRACKISMVILAPVENPLQETI